MKKVLILITFGIFLSALVIEMSGCKEYHAQQTPATSVPSASEPAVPIPPFDPAGTSSSSPSASSYSPYIGKPLSGAVNTVTEEAYSASIAGFKDAYKAQNRPRIAVYFNKALSDEVREWMTSTRNVMSGKGEKVSVGSENKNRPDSTVTAINSNIVTTNDDKKNGQAKVEGAEDAERGLRTYQQRHIEEGGRENPQEEWMWRFENYFLQPFLKAGAKVVDRTTILRLIAAASGKQGDPYSLNAVKKVEMDALAEYADIYVEILVTRDATSPTGYAFRALAKKTKDGIIVGSVAKAGQDYRYDKSYEAVTGSSGYELKKSSPALVLENVSMELAVDLMNSMANFWKE